MLLTIILCMPIYSYTHLLHACMQLRVDLESVQGDTKKLLTDHKENLIKVNKKLEAEKKNVVQSLEKKLETRRLQKVKAVMELAVPVNS